MGAHGLGGWPPFCHCSLWGARPQRAWPLLLRSRPSPGASPAKVCVFAWVRHRACRVHDLVCGDAFASVRERARARALACLRSPRSRHLCAEKGSRSRAGPERRGLTREGDATPALPLRGSFAEPPPSPERQREGGGHPRVWRPPALQCRRRHFGQWSHTILGTE